MATRRRRCGTMAAHMRLLEVYAPFRARQRRLELQTALRRRVAAAAGKPRLVKVPVVVNVVYRSDQQYVPLTQIRSQITVLNRDFSGRNEDRAKVPEPWKGLAADSRIRFKLAKVVRRKTTNPPFTTHDAVKYTDAGGLSPFEPDTHLNLWVCALADGLLGYAQFPGGPLETDGVVIDYRAFGTRDRAEAPFDLGRTATHEVGHYFNLRHIWADTEDCSGSDFVADTPNAAGPNYGTPTFPTVSCGNGPHGDMFVNYMDYVDDSAMYMFTAEQVLRMRTALEEARPGLG